MEKFIVSARKYRPNNFVSLIGQENIAVTLKNSIKRKQLAHAYLFCGPRGVGKTSTARIFAKTINCLNPSEDLEPCGVCESCLSFNQGRSFCIHELDAASNNSVDDIRLLTEKVRIPPQVGKYSVYIIDEVHMLSSAAFNAFLKTLEEPPEHAIFILATTEKHKILPTILSRCQTYDFNRITVDDIVKNLIDIASKEDITIDSDSLHVIAQKADGAMRDALTLFDQCVAYCGKEVTYHLVIKNLNVLDYEYYFNIIESSISGNYTKSLLLFDEILAKGFNALYFVGGISSHLRSLLVCKNNETINLLELSPSLVERYKQQSKNCDIKFLYNALGLSTKCEADYRMSNNQRLLVEFFLFKLATITHNSTSEQILISNTTIDKNELNQPATNLDSSSKSITTNNIVVNSDINESVNTGLSIKNILSKAQNKSNLNQQSAVKINDNKTFTNDDLIEAWDKLVESLKNSPRLASALQQANPSILSENNIVFYVSNAAQQSWLEKNSLPRFTAFLQKELSNAALRLEVRIKEIEETEKKLYMPHEKAEFLLKNNPELNELKKDLDLEIK